jgi:hypothetical protein
VIDVEHLVEDAPQRFLRDRRPQTLVKLGKRRIEQWVWEEWWSGDTCQWWVVGDQLPGECLLRVLIHVFLDEVTQCL